MNINDFLDNSDNSDEDYIPETSSANLPSEEESDGDVEDVLESEESTSTRGKRSRTTKKPRKKQKIKSQSPIKEVQTQSTDDLWADFKKDTGFKTKAERQLKTETSISNSNSKTATHETSQKCSTVEVPKTMKVTEILKFAGEEIKVEKEVPVPSASKNLTNVPSRGGISSILNSIGKKTKISTLEKSKLDWDNFKKEEKIEDELQAYGKSKDGYLERQDFLQRADLRRFEIEKDIRSTLRTNRSNNF